MKNLLKLSALAAVLVASATYSSAQVFVGSGETATTYNGYFDAPGCSMSSGGAACNNTINPLTDQTIGNVGAANIIATASIGSWLAPAGSSLWITGTGTIPNSGGANFGTSPIFTSPAGSDVVPDGYYTFTSANVAAGSTGFLSVMADDTVAVFFNGAPVINAANDQGNDGHCSGLAPNCNSLDTVAFTAPSAGNFVFIVEQTGQSAMGLDYEFAAAPVPEPSTLLMLGTGLLGSAGALFRRMRK